MSDAAAAPVARLRAFDELTTRELYRILRLRSAVFVVEQACAYQDLDGLDEGSWHYGLWRGERLLAYTRLLPPGLDFPDACAIGRVITAPEVRGTGLGRRHFGESVAACARLWPGVSIRLHAQTYLRDFYGAFGFAVDGEEYLEDGLPHVPMHRPPAG